MGEDLAPSAAARAALPVIDDRHEVVLFDAPGPPVGEDRARELARAGHRVFRLGSADRIDGPAYLATEREARRYDISLRAGLAFEDLDALRKDLGLGATAAIVSDPAREALAERLRTERAWAVVADGSWRNLEETSAALREAFAKLSVVVVTYNNRDLNRLCLQSLLARTEWPNREILVVDNASSDGTIRLLDEMSERHADLRVVKLGTNRGFPAAANIGLSEASGAHLVLLNNDTVVPRGWATALVRHLSRDPKLGLVGPVTNAIANEARVEVGYGDLADMPAWAADWMRTHDGETFPISMLAFYCVALRRTVLQDVGLLDERFGVGLFEDGDYNRRARERGWEVRCARDAFVHHWQMASFRRLGRDEYLRVYEENRKRFQEKWGGAG
jgi:GT2 family glycosyltransferase